MTKKKKIYKSSGKLVPYSEEKVRRSLLRSGADRDLANAIAQKVTAEIREGDTTRDVFKKAYAMLRGQKQRGVAARYNLKQAILDLGPTGFPFERFIGELFKRKGFTVHVSQKVHGACGVNHEVDVIVENEEKVRYIECKFRNVLGAQVDVKVPLYIHSRFEDIEANTENHEKRKQEPWIITNSIFSVDAIKYAECMNMKIIGWRYPHDFGLEHLVEDAKLHPITCLSNLTKTQKQELLQKGIVICSDLYSHEQFLKNLGVNVHALFKELQDLYKEE
ncbi:MAG: restriction endonuclease [Candidatus Magasanikbacteria bacterium]